jgi:hypothetical protein
LHIAWSAVALIDRDIAPLETPGGERAPPRRFIPVARVGYSVIDGKKRGQVRVD